MIKWIKSNCTNILFGDLGGAILVLADQVRSWREQQNNRKVIWLQVYIAAFRHQEWKDSESDLDRADRAIRVADYVSERWLSTTYPRRHQSVGAKTSSDSDGTPTRKHICEDQMSDNRRANIFNERIEAALDVANQYGGVDGQHHKEWVIDQMVRKLVGWDYEAWVDEYCEDGPLTWPTGIAP